MTRRARDFCGAALAVMSFCWSTAAARAADAPAERPIRALLVIGGGSHDYPKQKDILVEGISARANVVFQMAFDPAGVNNHANPVYDDPDWAKGFDVVVHDESVGKVTDLKLVERILKPHREGLPAVVLHSGMHAYRTEGWPKAITPWFEFTGLQTTGHGPQFPISIHFLDTKDPITAGFSDWTTIKEELYNNAAGKLLDTAHLLARGKQTVKDKTQENVVVWTNLYNTKTRVFATTLGHNNQTVEDPRYLDLVTRGLLWSVGKLDAEHLRPAKAPSATP